MSSPPILFSYFEPIFLFNLFNINKFYIIYKMATIVNTLNVIENKMNIILICIIIFIILCFNLFLGCRITRLGMKNRGKLYSKRYNQAETKVLSDNHYDSKSIFSNNEINKKCCEYSNYSSRNGCICFTPEQNKYLLRRGNNHTEYIDMIDL